MRVKDALARKVPEKLEEQFLALIGMTDIAQRSGYGVEDLVKSCLRSVGIVLFETLEAHRDVAAIAALGTPETDAIKIVVVIDHEADSNTIERVENLAQRTAEHVEEGVGAGGAHVALFDEGIALVAGASRRA